MVTKQLSIYQDAPNGYTYESESWTDGNRLAYFSVERMAPEFQGFRLTSVVFDEVTRLSGEELP